LLQAPPPPPKKKKKKERKKSTLLIPALTEYNLSQQQLANKDGNNQTNYGNVCFVGNKLVSIHQRLYGLSTSMPRVNTLLNLLSDTEYIFQV
jgi:hypothetical protein